MGISDPPFFTAKTPSWPYKSLHLHHIQRPRGGPLSEFVEPLEMLNRSDSSIWSGLLGAFILTFPNRVTYDTNMRRTSKRVPRKEAHKGFTKHKN